MRSATGAWNPLVPYLATAMRCVRCGADALLPDRGAVVCGACRARYEDPDTVLDVRVGDARARGAGPARRLVGARAWEERWLPGLLTRLGGPGADTVEALVLQRLRPVEGPVVDLACGHGGGTRLLARWVGVARALGVDPAAGVLDGARHDVRDPGLGWLRADAGCLPFRDGTVGAVHASGGLHRLGDVRATVAEVARVVGAGGSFTGWMLRRGARGAGLLAWLDGGAAVDVEAFRSALSDGDLVLHTAVAMGPATLFAATRGPRIQRR